jgi:hypothetical protein
MNHAPPSPSTLRADLLLTPNEYLDARAEYLLLCRREEAVGFVRYDRHAGLVRILALSPLTTRLRESW